MFDKIMVPAPAKINLHLAVGGKRDDGFHAIASIFQAVSLHDTVTVEFRPAGGLELDADCNCPAMQNTAWKAASAYLAAASRAGVKPLPGIHIAIDKRIPMGAGLGGGSSNAAATLVALSRLFQGVVDRQTVLGIAAATGSDVPFFMDSACSAVTGRGEFLQPLLSRTDYALVIVDPGFQISTREAYGQLDAARMAVSSPGPSDDELSEGLRLALDSYLQEPPRAWNFHNDFYPVLTPGLPGLEDCRQALLSAGADFAAMSGSGSSVFGVFSSPMQAERASSMLSARYLCNVALPLAKLENST